MPAAVRLCSLRAPLPAARWPLSSDALRARVVPLGTAADMEMYVCSFGPWLAGAGVGLANFYNFYKHLVVPVTGR